MLYELVWSPKAKDKLKKLDQKTAGLIIKKVDSIKENPIPYLKKLKEVKYWRLRVGDYRIIIDLDFAQRRIIILTLGHRKNIYQDI